MSASCRVLAPREQLSRVHRDEHASNVVIDRARKTTTATLIDVGMAQLDDKFFAVVDQRYRPRPGDRVKLGTGGLGRLDWTGPQARGSTA